MNILKKAAASKQTNLLRNKGFGVVVLRQKKDPQTLSSRNNVLSEDASASFGDADSCPTFGCEENVIQMGQSTNSLSLLGGYGVDTSDSD